MWHWLSHPESPARLWVFLTLLESVAWTMQTGIQTLPTPVTIIVNSSQLFPTLI